MNSLNGTALICEKAIRRPLLPTLHKSKNLGSSFFDGVDDLLLIGLSILYLIEL